MDRLAQIVGTTRSFIASMKEHSRRGWVVRGLVGLAVLAGLIWCGIAPPQSFIEQTTVRIEKGASVSEVAITLADRSVVAHPVLLRSVLHLTGMSADVQAGLYVFERPEHLLAVASRLVRGDYGIAPVRLTFIEGATLRDMGKQVEAALPDITLADFLNAAEGKEGYLFPDTYFLQPGTDAAAIVKTMHDTFIEKTAPLEKELQMSGRSLADVVTMASLIEKEARTPVDQHLISGILWNRIRLGMLLQVDAVFGYIFNRPTYSPSPTDLKVNSPYNTYTHVGLPPGPIGNPGLAALEAAANPTKTNYLYYITGNDGNMYYATTYAAHQANIRKYLR